MDYKNLLVYKIRGNWEREIAPQLKKIEEYLYQLKNTEACPALPNTGSNGIKEIIINGNEKYSITEIKGLKKKTSKLSKIYFMERKDYGVYIIYIFKVRELDKIENGEKKYKDVDRCVLRFFEYNDKYDYLRTIDGCCFERTPKVINYQPAYPNSYNPRLSYIKGIQTISISGFTFNNPCCMNCEKAGLTYNDVETSIALLKLKKIKDPEAIENGLSDIPNDIYYEELLPKNIFGASYEWGPGEIKDYNYNYNLVNEGITNLGINEFIKNYGNNIKEAKFTGIETNKVDGINLVYEDSSRGSIEKCKSKYGFDKINLNEEFSPGQEILKMSFVLYNTDQFASSEGIASYSVWGGRDIKSGFKNCNFINKARAAENINDNIYTLIGFNNTPISFTNISSGSNIGKFCILYGKLLNFKNLTELKNKILVKIPEQNKISDANKIKVTRDYSMDSNTLKELSNEISKNKWNIAKAVLYETADNIFNKFESTAKSIYDNNNASYLKGTEMEKTDCVGFLDCLLAISFTTGSTTVADSCLNKLKKFVNKGTDRNKINQIYKDILNSQSLLKNESGNNVYNFENISSNTYKSMLKNYVDKWINSIEENSGSFTKDRKLNRMSIVTYPCYAKRKLKLTSISSFKNDNSGYYKNVKKRETNKRIATIIPSNEPLQNIDENSTDKINMLRCEEFIQSWMMKEKQTNEKEQYFVPIEGYYDMLSGMTPYVDIGFRMNFNTLNKDEDGNFIDADGDIIFEKKEGGYIDKETGNTISKEDMAKKLSSTFKHINSIDYPYLRSMNIEDTGIKKLTLVLFDPDFGSFTKFKNSDDVFSLESLIRGAMENPYFSTDWNEDESASYDPQEDNDTNGIGSDYLNIDRGFDSVSPTNLTINFGYADYDQKIKKDKDGKNNDKAYNLRFGDGASYTERDARWWDARYMDTRTPGIIEKVKKYVSEGKIVNPGSFVDIPSELNFSYGDNSVNSLGTDLTMEKFLNSPFQTTSRSREYEFMITDFRTEFRNDGIQYTIQAIESKDATTMKSRFLQRFAEITANPEEMLYRLMHIFNEDNDGNNVSGSNVKICLLEDEDDIMSDMLNMNYDYKKMKKEEITGDEADDIYTMACSGNGVKFDERYLKEITLKFGSDDAIKNYNRKSSQPPLYKSVAQLINEFCASCPPKQKRIFSTEIADENGNPIISNSKNSPARPLKWFTVKDTKNDIIYICLYYRKTKKLNKIRVYSWGPNNPTLSCVKNIEVKNANEFAVLSGVRAFKSDGILNRTQSMVSGGNKVAKDNIENNDGKMVELAGANADNYINAYSSSMYNMTMDVLGDPSLGFDGGMQPYTYPVEVDLLMPQNEFTREVIGSGSSKYKEKIEAAIKRNMPRFDNSGMYKTTGWYQRDKGLQGQGASSFTQIQKSGYGNQILHEASGFYVISKITHNITTSEYKTTMELVSYPNIQNDVLKNSQS